MAGNGLSGSLPELPLSSAITHIALSNNFISGTIPKSYFDARLYKLDLSTNKIRGHLNTLLFKNLTVKLSGNRISGTVPEDYSLVHDVDILNGNLFECQSNSDLPRHDENAKEYTCGSNQLDYSLITWFVSLCLVASAVCSIIIILRSRARLPSISESPEHITVSDMNRYSSSASLKSNFVTSILLSNFWNNIEV
jgi:hypothetical protein